LALLLDADPKNAVSRKPEYPLEFVHRNRNAYLEIANMAGLTILAPSSIPETTEAIRNALASLKPDAGAAVPPGHAFPVSTAKTPGG
jgi:hypothetical protein